MSNKTNTPVHGYKVFRPDWTCNPTGKNCKQYTCPGKFEEEGELNVCGHGMHFCQTAADCFNYYNFDSNNKVAEVIAYGEVKTEGDKSCTDKLEIVREIPWDEVLRIVNIGKNCTGINNTGNRNTGHYNTGDRNTRNCNTGDKNTGDRNAGDCNAGDRNTGNRNTGSYNTGNYNTGECNTGSGNTGDRNTGNMNSGSFNTGDFNNSSFNAGCFNVKEHKIMLFDKPSDMTYQDWLDSKARELLRQIPKSAAEWVNTDDMTDEEKVEHSTYKTTGGYLKELDKSECCQMWWDSLDIDDKEIIKAIPNFDPDIFYECTGIKVD